MPPSRGPSCSGARIASANPRAGVASGFRNTSRSPGAGARAGVRARGEAGVAARLARRSRRGASSRTASSVPSADALSTMTSSSRRRAERPAAGARVAKAARLLYVTMIDRQPRCSFPGSSRRHASLRPPERRFRCPKSATSLAPRGVPTSAITGPGCHTTMSCADTADRPLLLPGRRARLQRGGDRRGDVRPGASRARPELDVLVVDDGSTDATQRRRRGRRGARPAAAVQPRHRRRRAGRLHVRPRERLRLHGPGRRRRPARPGGDRRRCSRRWTQPTAPT